MFGDGSLNLAKMEVYVDPKAEWEQMFDELWRIERDYFYVPNMHGLDGLPFGNATNHFSSMSEVVTTRMKKMCRLDCWALTTKS